MGDEHHPYPADVPDLGTLTVASSVLLLVLLLAATALLVVELRRRERCSPARVGLTLLSAFAVAAVWWVAWSPVSVDGTGCEFGQPATEIALMRDTTADGPIEAHQRQCRAIARRHAGIGLPVAGLSIVLLAGTARATARHRRPAPVAVA